MAAFKDRAFAFTSPFANNLHCGCVPPVENRKAVSINGWFKYWGYETPAARAKKMAFYREHDPVHFDAVFKKVAERVKYPTRPWIDGIDGREIGISGIVEF